MPFVKLVIVYDVVVDGKLSTVACNQFNESVLYCKLYDVIGRPPVSDGAVQLTVLVLFWYEVEEFIIGAPGVVDGVAEFAISDEFVRCDEYRLRPLEFTAATWK